MESRGIDSPSERVELLLLELARAHQWTGMYPAGHPFLTERVTEFDPRFFDSFAEMVS